MISHSYIISKRFIIMKYTSTYEILCNKHNWQSRHHVYWTTLSPAFLFFNKTKCWSCSLFNSSALAKSAKVNGEYHDPSTISSLASIITTKNNIATSLSTNNIRILLSSYSFVYHRAISKQNHSLILLRNHYPISLVALYVYFLYVYLSDV